MIRPWCEEMTTRPAQSGWQQWGVLSVDGKTFEPLYGLETALPRESALYYLAAAGICDIQGQPRAGAMMPSEPPAPVVANLPTPNPLIAEQPLAAAETPQPQGTPTWAWGIGAVLLLIVGGAAATRARRKQTDTTPQPQGFTFNKGDSDATR
jgi:hypothetical protein